VAKPGRIKHVIHFFRPDVQNIVLVKGYPATMTQGWPDHAIRIDSPNEVMIVEATLNDDPIPNAFLTMADLHYRSAADII
jgi:hypothetical protein